MVESADVDGGNEEDEHDEQDYLMLVRFVKSLVPERDFTWQE